MTYDVVSEALAALISAHPEVVYRQPEPRPEAAAWSAAPPTDTNHLHRCLTAELTSTTEALVACEISIGNWDDERRWEQLAGAVSGVVQEWPELGLSPLDKVGPGHPRIDHAVIRGWRASHPDSHLAPQILDCIASLELEPVVAEVTVMLGGFATAGSEPVDWFTFPQSQHLAEKCWETIAPTAVSGLENADDFAMIALNHPAGHLAEYWVERIAYLWRAMGDNWKGIPAEEAEYLAEMISGANPRSEAVEIAFCRYLHFFLQADAQWCRQHLYPLLDWANSSRAAKAWSGYLSHGAWTNRLLADGFLEMLVSTVSRRDQLDKPARRHLPGLLAKIAIAAEVDPRSWVRDLVTGSTVSDRVAWARALRHHLSSLDAEEVEKQWQRWIRDSVSDRVSSVPRLLEPEEASEMVSWPLFLTESMENAIELMLQAETAGLGLHNLFLHDLGEEQVERAPEPVAQLLLHVLKSTNGECLHAFEVNRAYGQFKSAGIDPEVLRQIAEEAMRLGIGLP